MSVYWQNETARILHVDMRGSMSVEQISTIIEEVTKIVEAAKEPVYLIFDATDLNLPSTAITTAFSNRAGSRLIRHPNVRLIASVTHNPVVQYLGKFFAGDRLIIAKTFSEALNKLEIRMHEIGAL
jgi:predicted metal-dependent peptidase